jgi:hypothetical protein
MTNAIRPSAQAMQGFIDLEASGFGARSYPIEVGLVMPGGETYCTLIVPEPDWHHWDASAEKVHGIAREVLLQHGRTSHEVATELNRRLQGLTMYSDAWYHDYNWLSRLFDAADASPQFKLEDLRQLLSPHEMEQWDAMKAQVIQDLQLSRHRASNDAKVLQQTLKRVRETPT